MFVAGRSPSAVAIVAVKVFFSELKVKVYRNSDVPLIVVGVPCLNLFCHLSAVVVLARLSTAEVVRFFSRLLQAVIAFSIDSVVVSLVPNLSYSSDTNQ